MDAFQYQYGTLDGYYVDGISITTQGYPMKHIWTFAIGISIDHNFPDWNCPCEKYPGRQPPSFVGNDYYCESGSHGWPTSTWLITHRLWDGNCSSKSNCCLNQSTPYFTKSLGATTTQNLQVRLCGSDHIDDEDVGLERMVLYVR